METNDLPLADIHLPPEPGYWPLAPGWWIVISIILLVLILSWFLYRKKKREAYRKKALHEFKQLQQQFSETQKIDEFLQATSLLLRRTAFTAQPKNFDPALKGDAWLQWLDNYCPKLTTTFSSGVGKALIVGQYQKAPTIPIDAFVNLVEEWIANHRNHWQKMKKANIHV